MRTIETNVTVTPAGQIILPAPLDIPPGQHRAVLVIEEESSAPVKRPRRSLKGLWADLNMEITEEDFAEARREMWGTFPRDLDLE